MTAPSMKIATAIAVHGSLLRSTNHATLVGQIAVPDHQNGHEVEVGHAKRPGQHQSAEIAHRTLFEPGCEQGREGQAPPASA